MEDLRRRVQDAEMKADAATVTANNAMAAVEVLRTELRTGVNPATNLKPPFKPIMKAETEEGKSVEDEEATDREIRRFFANADQVTLLECELFCLTALVFAPCPGSVLLFVS